MQDNKKRLLRGGGRLIALVLLGAVLFAAPWAAETAVTDVKEKLRGPQPEWTGVLSAGIVPSFPTVNLNGWLAARSREFEKQQGCVLLTLRGEWHYGSVCLGDIFMGVKNRYTPAGLETEDLPLPDALFARLTETQEILRRII